ncbi:MAG: hypothetical protein D6766_12800, partial [Verrucomicrobia bacterium]
MPLLRVQTNREVPIEQQQILLAELTELVARELAKPRQYVQVVLEAGVPMAFAGTTEPTAVGELASLGLPDDAPARLSARLAEVLHQRLEVPPDRL